MGLVYIYSLMSAERPRSKDILVTLNTARPRAWSLTPLFNKRLRFLGEMADCSTEAGKIQYESETSCAGKVKKCF